MGRWWLTARGRLLVLQIPNGRYVNLLKLTVLCLQAAHPDGKRELIAKKRDNDDAKPIDKVGCKKCTNVCRTMFLAILKSRIHPTIMTTKSNTTRTV